MITFKLATPEDAPALAPVCKRSFDSDIQHGAPQVGGPPGYDDPATHRTWMQHADYYVIRKGEQIVGAVMAAPRGDAVYEMCGLFIDPDYHRQGIGRAAMTFIEAQYPDVRRWWLDTPAWNTRTRPFYESLGYHIASESDDGGMRFIRYEKAVPPASGGDNSAQNTVE